MSRFNLKTYRSELPLFPQQMAEKLKVLTPGTTSSERDVLGMEVLPEDITALCEASDSMRLKRVIMRKKDRQIIATLHPIYV